MRTQTKKSTQGFTIIEVLIVLAIAGLIMAIVFLAVPALRRNANNNSRRSDAAHLAGIVNEYASNHSGQLPTSGQLQTATASEKWAIFNAPNGSTVVAGNGTVGNLTDARVNTGTTCDPTANPPVIGGASSRSFSVSFQVETGGTPAAACIQG
ncbi:MAG TPA: prepilin-type N-terminal cleavage/methylation domain-containing protein [Candidatus Saccharimonadales bacterium]|nr:prepilin-type N-terminal cleavage/methylation domain-containing protein [Candidatus Saccharimonadales bacterium]